MPYPRPTGHRGGMYATFDTRSPAELAATPALVEAYPLRRLGDDRAATLALWTETTDPTPSAVEEDRPGPAAGRSPAAAAAAWFDGPLSQARVAAARFGFRERIGPALAAVP